MQSPVSFLGAFAAVKDSRIFMELFFLDGNIDADDILPNDTTCADIQVSIFIRICARSERKEKKMV